VYRELFDLLRAVSTEDRDAALRELSEAAEDVAGPRSTHRPLSQEEVIHLAGAGSIEIGAHTTSHPRLSALPLAAQRREIAGSRARLRGMTMRAVTSFAYPFGTSSDFTADTAALVHEAGFTLACSVESGLVRTGSDPLRVPRMLVRDWSAETFAGRLREWFGDGTVTAST
jgi:peptidoglycan/xylan/chitin deacetylase (PgdA/CDA1 family)